MKNIIILGIALFLAGCQAFTRLPETESIVKDSGNSFAVTVPGGWVKYNNGKGNSVVLTKDGPALQLISVEQRDLKKPFETLDIKLESNVLVSEVAEHFIEDYKAINQGVSIETDSLVPMNIHDNDGFKLALSATNSAGLEFKILVFAIQTKSKLYTLSYQSPALFFYDKELQSFETMAESFKLIEAS